MTDLVKQDNRVDMLCDIEVPDKFYNRLCTGIQTLDELFGGMAMPGILPGAAMIYTGMPGAGKSTMSLQLANALQSVAGRNVLYNVGEESKAMVKMAADRIGVAGRFGIGQISEVSALVEFCRKNEVEVLFQDSLQSMHDSSLFGHRLLKATTKKLIGLAKDEGITVIIIGHITKGGRFAGPQEIIHDIDVHAHLSINPETGSRTLELLKNRFGPSCMPVEFSLAEGGFSFNPLVQVQPRESGGSKTLRRREEVKAIIREQLLSGKGVSGYCFSRLGVDCSGGFWRGMLQRTCQELEAEGRKVHELRVDGRAHSFVEV